MNADVTPCTLKDGAALRFGRLERVSDLDPESLHSQILLKKIAYLSESSKLLKSARKYIGLHFSQFC